MAEESGFLSNMKDFLKSSFSDAAAAVGDTLKSAPKLVSEPVVNHVTNEGMTGKAAEALGGRDAQIKKAVDAALGM